MTTPKTDYDPDFTLEELVRWRPELNGAWLMVNPELPWPSTGKPKFTHGDGTFVFVIPYRHYPPPLKYDAAYHPHFQIVDGQILHQTGVVPKKLSELTIYSAGVANSTGDYDDSCVPPIKCRYMDYNWIEHALIIPGSSGSATPSEGKVDLCPVDKCLLDVIYIAELSNMSGAFPHRIIIPKYPLRRLYNQWKAETKPVDLLGAPPRHTPTLEITETAPTNTNVLLPDLSPIRDAIRHAVALSRPMPAGTDKKAQLASVHEALTQLLRRVEELV